MCASGLSDTYLHNRLHDFALSCKLQEQMAAKSKNCMAM